MREAGVVPVVEIDDAERAVELARALLDSGLAVVEITFRTSAAASAIAAISRSHREMLVIAGTVTAPDQVKAAVEAGAQLLVAPGLNPRVVQAAGDAAVEMVPGVCTPTEVERALEAGCSVVKFFPAEAIGGVRFLRALAAPYGPVGWIPTGGITLDLLPQYLALPSVIACGGSWIAPRAEINAGAWASITERARRVGDTVTRSRAHGAR
ncbi:MAG: bifunctional 4-hydroxy-2-oxoglutarate aldolase/2-dehydro-3-deoxy-phosphogluconate aldolase [Myxococcales bacterium]|nr:bifunctional 4-hydroxy-2-oxoglutarate aldolase/2-dehydro-3-deoxy-phosphogluconate aldolase [Myxococcales bacterium]